MQGARHSGLERAVLRVAHGGRVHLPADSGAGAQAGWEHGEIAGAALDVLEEEGAVREEHELVLHGHPGEQSLRVLLQNHMLMRMSNVIVTPHNAFNTGEALAEIARVTAENISAFASGR